MSYLKGELQCPIDSEIYINLRQKIITQGLLTKETIWKLLYQMTSVFDYAKRKGIQINPQIKLDYFYLPRQIDCQELFFSSEIFKASQFYQNQLQILKNLFLEIGINPKDVNSFKSIEECYNYYLAQLNIEKNIQRLILEKIFGFKIIDVLFWNNCTKIFEIEKPFSINSDAVIVKWAVQGEEDKNFTEIENISQMKKQLFKMNKSYRLNKIQQILSFAVINSKELIIIQEKFWKTLTQFTQQFAFKLTVSDKMKICLSLTHALEAIHQTGIIHRDIKPDNIMVYKKNRFSNDIDYDLENLEWLLIDYDKSTQKLAKENEAYLGTQDYRPPELVEDNQFNEAYDIWQLGMCFLYLMMGRDLDKYGRQRIRPYPLSEYDTYLQRGYNLLQDEKQYTYSPTMYTLITKMTSYNPKDRPNLEYIKQTLHFKLNQ